MNAITPVASPAAAVVLFDQDKFDAFYAKLKADVESVPVDLSTKKGRDAIASVAAKVRSEKASIDKDRLRLTKEWRDMTAQVNGAWNEIKDRLDTLAVAARKPLTDWEEAEKARITECDAVINKLALDGVVTLDDTSETVRLRGKAVWETAIDPERFGDKFDQAVRAKEHAVDMLKIALTRLTREEEERAELERLRTAEVERAAKEQAEREAREAEERAAAEAKAEEERRAAAEKAEQERIAAVQREAQERAKAEAEAAAQAERDRIQREHEEALAAERRRAEDAERARQAEIDRIAREESARKAEAGRLAAEQAKREADQKHRSAVMKSAKEAIMTCGVDEETAKKIVLLIRSGEVPNVSLRF